MLNLCIWVFILNVQGAVTVYADIHFMHLPLTPAFRAKLQSQNILVCCLITCNMSSTVLSAFENYLISTTTLFWINRLLCKIKTACSCFCFPKLGMKPPSRGQQWENKQLYCSPSPSQWLGSGWGRGCGGQHCEVSVNYLTQGRWFLVLRNIIW